MTENNGLPEGWEWTTLESIAEIILGQSPPSSTYNEHGEGLPFYQGKAEFGDIYPTPRKWCNAPRKIAEDGDVLISVRAPVGPTNICPETSCIGRGLAAIRPSNGISTKFILYLLRRFEADLAGKGTGTTFQAITGNQLKSFEVPIPPQPEQERIVAKIEETFTQLEAGVAELQNAKAQLKRYRAAVLKSAVEGELTREWREAHRRGTGLPLPQDGRNKGGRKARPDAEKLLARILSERREKWEADGGKGKYKEPAAPDTDNLPELPEGWVWVRLCHGLMFVSIKNGTS
jgi:type I restriction enzyme, S subunit